MEQSQIVELEIERIIRSESRSCDPDYIASLAESIRDVGLLNPITVNSNHALVAGFHRIEAHIRLGKKTIPARVCDLDGLKADLAKIDENLIRNHLTALEHADATAMRKKIYEELHPETKRGANPGLAGGGKKPKDENISGFAEDTGRKTNQSPRSVQLDVQISKISKAAKDLIRNTPIANRKAKLILLSREPESKQLDVAKAMLDGSHRTPKADLSAEPKPDLRATTEVDNSGSFCARIVQLAKDLELHDPERQFPDLEEPRVQSALKDLREKLDGLIRDEKKTAHQAFSKPKRKM